MNINKENLYLDMIDKERNIYEPAQLYEQNRINVKEYIELLKDPESETELKLSDDEQFLIGEQNYPIQSNVPSFTKENFTSKNWKILNEQFLNYHKSLSVYTAVNSLPIVNYLADKTGFGHIKSGKVLDIGGGTGHSQCSFFHFPEKIEYFLLDPNIRLLHDQFLRIYPKLSFLKMAHIKANAEYLPVKNDTFEYVISLSAVDHFNDYKKFISEAYRVLKPKGKFLLTSHLDISESGEDKTSFRSKIFSRSILERITRYLYFKKHAVGDDDHTLHIENQDELENQMSKVGFQIEKSEIFKRHFYIIGVK